MNSDLFCPEYRLRLFQSVDLVGSTAFKARHSSAEDGQINPLWVTQIKHFYREFPRILSSNFAKQRSAEDCCKSDNGPAVWKTIGDEIIFCVRLTSLEHLSICTVAFIRSLEEYGRILEKEGRTLDVKGVSWVAAFPSPNITVDLKLAIDGQEKLSSYGDQSDEADEKKADKSPHLYDFLGPQIDAGFRSGKLSSADTLSASIELAFLIAKAAQANLIDPKFSYNDRHNLKGVLNSRPYPLMSLYVQRNERRRKVLNYERNLRGVKFADPQNVEDFLTIFMEDEGVDLPLLPRSGGKITREELPEDYKRYEREWETGAFELRSREKNEESAEQVESNGGDLPATITVALDREPEAQ